MASLMVSNMNIQGNVPRTYFPTVSFCLRHRSVRARMKDITMLRGSITTSKRAAGIALFWYTLARLTSSTKMLRIKPTMQPTAVQAAPLDNTLVMSVLDVFLIASISVGVFISPAQNPAQSRLISKTQRSISGWATNLSDVQRLAHL